MLHLSLSCAEATILIGSVTAKLEPIRDNQKLL
jgi:hypothetical protein